MKTRTERCNSRGFTLVEVLVVIAIIGILVGLIVPAVQAAQRRARLLVIKGEMQQIVYALDNFRTSMGGGQYPPDGTLAGANQDLQLFCKAAWPRAPWGSSYRYPTITPDTALCFWLGGAQDANGNFIGYSSNPTDPFDQSQTSQSRQPPLFEFDKTRVVKSSTSSNLKNSPGYNWNLCQYYPPNRKDPTTGTYAPYVYFKAVSGRYTTTPTPVVTAVPNALPYQDSTASPTSPAYVNLQSFQLLCPGLDGLYGNTKGKPPLYPSGSNYDQANGLDDMTNFSGATVGDDTH